MKKILTITMLVASFFVGQAQIETDAKTYWDSVHYYTDELMRLCYSPDRDSTNSFKRVVVYDTLSVDSAVFEYYPSGALYSEGYYIKNECRAYREFYSNGQLIVQNQVRKGSVLPMKESLPVKYGKYCYLYGFKVYKRTFISYEYDGSPMRIEFLGKFRGRNVLISIEFIGPGNSYAIAWIYKKRKNKSILIEQFEWDSNSQTWEIPAVDHLGKRRK